MSIKWRIKVTTRRAPKITFIYSDLLDAEHWPSNCTHSHHQDGGCVQHDGYCSTSRQTRIYEHDFRPPRVWRCDFETPWFKRDLSALAQPKFRLKKIETETHKLHETNKNTFTRREIIKITIYMHINQQLHGLLLDAKSLNSGVEFPKLIGQLLYQKCSRKSITTMWLGTHNLIQSMCYRRHRVHHHDLETHQKNWQERHASKNAQKHITVSWS